MLIVIVINVIDYGTSAIDIEHIFKWGIRHMSLLFDYISCCYKYQNLSENDEGRQKLILGC